MNKLKRNDEDKTHVLYGQTTDAGGGGVTDSLHATMHKLELCIDPSKYRIATCAIHGLQLQLHNSVCAALGDGGLEKVNAMQLLHSVYDLRLKAVSWAIEMRHGQPPIVREAHEAIAQYKRQLPHLRVTCIKTQGQLTKIFIDCCVQLY